MTDASHSLGAARAAGTPLRILTVCWGNSARSIMCEALLRHLGHGKIEAHSAGIEAIGVNPMAIRVLEEAGIPTDGLRSKNVSEYMGQSFDYVITVCDDARDACPIFPGVHESLHWGYQDPASVVGTEAERLAAFRSVFTGLGERVHAFLPMAERFAATRKPVELA